jgi:tRNA threonylcarbamoyl adenosine modification protein YeaZ
MQKPQLNDNYFLAIQNTYDHVEVGLFSFGLETIARISITKIDASKKLIPVIAECLQEQSKKLSDLPFIVVNQGPGPFTTLRTVITTANGLSFATGIPLIGVDALAAMASAWQDNRYAITVIMLNAFAFDVYVLIEKNGAVIFNGYKNIDQLLHELKQEPKTIRCIGNGADLYREKIKAILGSKVFIPEPNPAYCSLEQIARIGYQKWHAGNRGTNQLLPLYLKQHSA